MRKKIGLFNDESIDLTLVEDLLMFMYKHQADYTNTFRNLVNPSQLKAELIADEGFKNWQIQWNERLLRQPQTTIEVTTLMDNNNPLLIPRNHLVEDVLATAIQGDIEPFHDFLDAISEPYQIPKNKEYLQGPIAGFDDSYQTFCGT